MALSRVIEASEKNQKTTTNRTKQNRSVNRDSKWNLLLHPSLLRNARVALICNASPFDLQETQSILSFAAQAQLVSTRARKNEIPIADQQSLLNHFQSSKKGRSSKDQRRSDATCNDVSDPNEEREEKFRQLQRRLFESNANRQTHELLQMGSQKQTGRRLFERRYSFSEGMGMMKAETHPSTSTYEVKSDGSSEELPSRTLTDDRLVGNMETSSVAEIAMLRQALSRKANQVQFIEGRYDDIYKTLSERDAEVDQLRDELHSVRKSLDQSRKSLDRMSGQKKNEGSTKRIDEEVDHLRSRLADRRKERMALVEQTQAIIADRERFAIQNEEIHEQFKELETKNTDLTKEKKSLVQQLEVNKERHRKEMAETESEKKRLKKELELKEKELKSVKETTLKYEKEAVTLRSENTALHSKVSSLRVQLAAALMESADKATSEKKTVGTKASPDSGATPHLVENEAADDVNCGLEQLGSMDTTTDISAITSSSIPHDGNHQDDSAKHSTRLKNKTQDERTLLADSKKGDNASSNTNSSGSGTTTSSFPQSLHFSRKTVDERDNKNPQPPTGNSNKSEIEGLHQSGVANEAGAKYLERKSKVRVPSSKCRPQKEPNGTNQSRDGTEEETSVTSNMTELSEECGTIDTAQISEVDRQIRAERDEMIRFLEEAHTAIQTSNEETCKIESLLQKTTKELRTLQDAFASAEDRKEFVRSQRIELDRNHRATQSALNEATNAMKTLCEKVEATATELTKEKASCTSLRESLEKSERGKAMLMSDHATMKRTVADSQAKIAHLQEEAEKLRTERDDMTKVLEELTNAADEIHLDMEGLITEKKNLRQELQVQENEIGSLRHQLRTSEEARENEKKAFSEERASLVRQMDTVSEQICEVNRERRQERESMVYSVKFLEVGMENVTAERNELCDETTTLRNVMEEKQSEIKALLSNLTKANAEIETTTAENREMEMLLRDATANIRMLVSDLERALEKNAQLSRDRDLDRQDLATANDLLNKASAETDSLRRKVQAMSSKLEEVVTSCSNLRCALSRSESNRNALERECEALKKIIERCPADLNQSMSDPSPSLRSLRSSNSSDQGNNRDLVGQLTWEKEALVKKCKAMEDEVESLQKEMDAFSENLDISTKLTWEKEALLKKCTNLEDEVKILHEKVKELSEDLDQSSTALSKVRTERDVLVTACKSLSEEKKVLSQEKLQLADELYDANTEVKQLRDQISPAQHELTSASSKESSGSIESKYQVDIDHLANNNTQLQEELMKTQVELAKSSSQLSESQREVESLRTGNHQMKKENEELKRQQLRSLATGSSDGSSQSESEYEREWARLAKSYDEDVQASLGIIKESFESQQDDTDPTPQRYLGSTPLAINVQDQSNSSLVQRIASRERALKTTNHVAPSQVRWQNPLTSLNIGKYANASTPRPSLSDISRQPATSAVPRERKSDLSWQEGTIAFLMYMRGYPHAAVPEWFRDCHGRKLGKWIEDCRQDWKSGALTHEKAAALERICPFWKLTADTEESPQRNFSFETWLQALDCYQKAYGKVAAIPKDYRDPYGRTLGYWVQKQRFKRRNGILNQKQISELDARAFVWK